eukprot:1152538-Pelagomonas_calceolata.AAC.4
MQEIALDVNKLVQLPEKPYLLVAACLVPPYCLCLHYVPASVPTQDSGKPSLEPRSAMLRVPVSPDLGLAKSQKCLDDLGPASTFIQMSSLHRQNLVRDHPRLRLSWRLATQVAYIVQQGGTCCPPTHQGCVAEACFVLSVESSPGCRKERTRKTRKVCVVMKPRLGAVPVSAQNN